MDIAGDLVILIRYDLKALGLNAAVNIERPVQGQGQQEDRNQTDQNGVEAIEIKTGQYGDRVGKHDGRRDLDMKILLRQQGNDIGTAGRTAVSKHDADGQSAQDAAIDTRQQRINVDGIGKDSGHKQ